MSVSEEVREIIHGLAELPSEKVQEVRDFVLFLKEHYGQRNGEDWSDEWTEEDIRDLTRATLRYAEETLYPNPDEDDYSR